MHAHTVSFKRKHLRCFKQENLKISNVNFAKQIYSCKNIMNSIAICEKHLNCDCIHVSTFWQSKLYFSRTHINIQNVHFGELSVLLLLLFICNIMFTNIHYMTYLYIYLFKENYIIIIY